MREGQEHMPYEQGVFVDIFPGDSVPDNMFFKKTAYVSLLLYQENHVV